MTKITVVCHKDHLHGYEDFEGKCLLCEMEKLYAEINQITHQLYDYRAAFMRARDREWVGLATGEAREFYESDLSREELIHKIDEFLQEKNT
jgi:hypothetical protein